MFWSQRNTCFEVLNPKSSGVQVTWFDYIRKTTCDLHPNELWFCFWLPFFILRVFLKCRSSSEMFFLANKILVQVLFNKHEMWIYADPKQSHRTLPQTNWCFLPIQDSLRTQAPFFERVHTQVVDHGWRNLIPVEIYETNLGDYSFKPIPSIYGIFAYIWMILMANVVKYTMHKSYGYVHLWKLIG